MTEFEPQVLADLSVLKSQISALLGDGNSGESPASRAVSTSMSRASGVRKASPSQQGAVFTLVQFVLELLRRK
jgi:hypothetical protein